MDPPSYDQRKIQVITKLFEDAKDFLDGLCTTDLQDSKRLMDQFKAYKLKLVYKDILRMHDPAGLAAAERSIKRYYETGVSDIPLNPSFDINKMCEDFKLTPRDGVYLVLAHSSNSHDEF